MENIKLVQTQSEEELKKEVEIWYKLFVGRSRIVWIGVAAMLVGAGALIYRQSGGAKAAVLVVCAVLFFFYIVFLRKRLAITQVYNALRMSPIFGLPTEIEITPGGTLTIKAGDRSGTHHLKDFAVAAETGEALLLFVSKSGWITLLRNAFRNDEDYAALRHNVELNNIKIECFHDKDK